MHILIYNPQTLICISYICSVVPLFGSLKTSMKPFEQLLIYSKQYHDLSCTLCLLYACKMVNRLWPLWILKVRIFLRLTSSFFICFFISISIYCNIPSIQTRLQNHLLDIEPVVSQNTCTIDIQ